MFRSTGIVMFVLVIACAAPPHAFGQDHSQMQMSMPGATGWTFTQEGAVFAVVNRQGGPRGGREFVVPNWWMGMAMRDAGRSRFGLTAMFSLDPATVGEDGYREIFQVGEALRGLPLVDRQHPHDFFMQLSASWRFALTGGTGLTFSGGPVGEPALGPVAFMHRESAAALPMAPLSHHTSDSTHVSFGVATAAIDHGAWTLEASAFNGREPDEHRWDFDFGPLDSVSGRVSYRPSPGWALQVSTGHLRHPEELEPGDIQRTTASASWRRKTDKTTSAVTLGYGVNATTSGRRQAVFGEFNVDRGRTSWFGRLEDVQVETALLQANVIPSVASGALRSPVGAVTLGVGRNVHAWNRADALVGFEGTFYAVPEALKPTHGAHPASFQVFFRVRLRQNEMTAQ